MITARAAKQMAERRNRDLDVVDAAIKVFYTKGYGAASIQDVADEVGVLKGSLYHYISSKEELLFRILKESHDQAREIMDEVAALEVAPIDRLRIYLERMHLWYLTHLERASVYINQQRYLTGERREEVRIQARDFEQFLRLLLAEARGSGALRADTDLRLASFFILGGLNGLPGWYRPDGAHPPEKVAELFTQMALRSLQPDPEPVQTPAPKPARKRRAP